MPRKRTLKLPPIDFGTETPGQRLARLRKERGFTQVQLAEQVGIIQSLVSDYETDRLKLSAEMVVRFAMALDVSTDDLLHPEAKKKKPAKGPSLKIVRRMVDEVRKMAPCNKITAPEAVGSGTDAGQDDAAGCALKKR